MTCTAASSHSTRSFSTCPALQRQHTETETETEPEPEEETETHVMHFEQTSSISATSLCISKTGLASRKTSFCSSNKSLAPTQVLHHGHNLFHPLIPTKSNTKPQVGSQQLLLASRVTFNGPGIRGVCFWRGRFPLGSCPAAIPDTGSPGAQEYIRQYRSSGDRVIGVYGTRVLWLK